MRARSNPNGLFLSMPDGERVFQEIVMFLSRLRIPRASALPALLLVAVTLSAAAGDYPVGHLSITNYDASRSNRAIRVELYYPATGTGENTPVASQPTGGFPVVVFAHGRQMPLSVYSNLWAVLPPLGYVTACPNTVTGSFVMISYMQQQFALDLAHTGRWLQQQNTNAASPFFGRLATNTAMVGHSFGGGAALLAATSGVATAVAILASHVSTTTDLHRIRVPVLIFGGSEDTNTPVDPNQIGYYDAVRSDTKTLLNITGATHCKFAAYTYLCDELLEEGGTKGIPREEQQATTALFLHPWLDAVLNGSASARARWEDLLRTNNLAALRHWYPLSEPPVFAMAPSTNDGTFDLRWLSATSRVFQCQVTTNLSVQWSDQGSAFPGNASRACLTYPWTNWDEGAFFRLAVCTNPP